jgi:hypothetical protein
VYLFIKKKIGIYELATKTGGANGEAAGGTQLRGMRHTDSHFCFGRR